MGVEPASLSSSQTKGLRSGDRVMGLFPGAPAVASTDQRLLVGVPAGGRTRPARHHLSGVRRPLRAEWIWPLLGRASAC